MTRDHIIRMAMEADDYATHATDKNKSLDWYHVRDERFAALVAAREREACARACEDEAAEFRSQKEGCRDAKYDWKEDAAMECALAIRKRGEVKP